MKAPKLLFHALSFILLVVFFSSETLAQSEARSPKPKSTFASGNSALGIPLEIDNNILFLRVNVNGSRPLRFIFDTGASASAINSKLLDELKLKVQEQGNGTATGGNITVGLIKHVSLSVAGAEVTNQMIVSFSFDELPCVEFDGIIGFDFINQFIVELDYQKSVINLYDPRTYTYSGKGKVIPVQLGNRTPVAIVNLTVDGPKPMPGRLEIDTCGDGALVIYPRFVKRNRLSRSLRGGLKDTGRGAGGEYERITRRIKGAKLGPFFIDQPVVSFGQDEDGSASDGFDGILGGEILRRFKVVFDYSRRRMMLEPNSSFSDPYEVGMSGIGFQYDKTNCNLHRIESIEPNSPASESGLQPGDIVTAIDARPIEQISSNEFEQIFKQHGKQLTLTIKRGEEVIQKRITLRRSI